MKTLLSILLALCAAAAHAQTGTLVDVSVINRSTGRTLPLWSHQGRLYVAGGTGDRYNITLTNRTGARVLAVVSVDGVNVISGDTAAPSQSGYVLDPYARLEIAGWRKNMGEVAAFYFTPQPDSYASRTGRPDHVGVIGVAVFREAPVPRPLPSPRYQRPAPFSGAEEPRADASASRDRAEAAPGKLEQRAPEAQARLGTGHGEREASAARLTQFRRASSSPNEVVSVYYDTRANLLARGVIPTPVPPRWPAPNPFPGMRFAPDPSG